MARRVRPWLRAGRGWFAHLNGKQVSLGVTDPSDEAAAIAALQALLANLQQKQALPPSAPDWSAKVAAFLAHKVARGMAPRTVSHYQRHLAPFLARFGTLRADEFLVKPHDGSDHTSPLVEASCPPTWGPNTRRDYLATVQMLLGWCGFRVRLEKPGRESAGAGMVISDAVYNQALGCATGDLRPLLTFLWNTGCRPSEATALTAADIDWTAGTITLRKHKTRARSRGRARVIYLSPAALAVLTGQREAHPAGLLFPNRRGTAWRDKALAQAVWRVAQKIGHRVTAYGCRHSYCTRALEKGVPDTHVAALMGHGSTRMIHKHYSHLGENARLLKEVAAGLDAKV